MKTIQNITLVTLLSLSASTAFAAFTSMDEANAADDAQSDKSAKTQQTSTAANGSDTQGTQAAPPKVIPMQVSHSVANARPVPANDPKSAQIRMMEILSPIAVAAPEKRIIKIQDLFTIIVRENKTSSSDADMSSEKGWNIAAELAEYIKFENQKIQPGPLANGPLGIDGSWSNTYEGTGSASRKDSFTTRIQVKVVDVKPNGNLIFEGKKLVSTGEDSYIVTLTGECRSEDITADNTVLSTQVHGLELQEKPMGATRDATRRGWLMRAIDGLRIF